METYNTFEELDNSFVLFVNLNVVGVPWFEPLNLVSVVE